MWFGLNCHWIGLYIISMLLVYPIQSFLRYTRNSKVPANGASGQMCKIDVEKNVLLYHLKSGISRECRVERVGQIVSRHKCLSSDGCRRLSGKCTSDGVRGGKYPVICGEYKCSFNTICSAISAGYEKPECMPI